MDGVRFQGVYNVRQRHLTQQGLDANKQLKISVFGYGDLDKGIGTKEVGDAFVLTGADHKDFHAKVIPLSQAGDSKGIFALIKQVAESAQVVEPNDPLPADLVGLVQ